MTPGSLVGHTPACMPWKLSTCSRFQTLSCWPALQQSAHMHTRPVRKPLCTALGRPPVLGISQQYAVKVIRHMPWSRVRCHGCRLTHRQFHLRRYSLRITLNSTTLVGMRNSYAWTMKPWHRSGWRLSFNTVWRSDDEKIHSSVSRHFPLSTWSKAV